MATRKASPVAADADLRLALRDAVVRLGKPISSAELRKALPKLYQRPAVELTRRLDELVREGNLFVTREGKSTWYVDREPESVLAPLLQAVLREGPLGKTQLKTRVQRDAPGFERVLSTVLAKQITHGAVREHPRVGKQPVRYGLEPPDPTPFLAKTIRELAALAKKLSHHGVTPASIHAALGRALGLERARDPRADEAALRTALRDLASRELPGTLLSVSAVRAIRALRSFDKPRFDGAVLRLARAGELMLHHHDFPESLPEAERAALVQDEHGIHYVGIALREGGVRS